MNARIIPKEMNAETLKEMGCDTYLDVYRKFGISKIHVVNPSEQIILNYNHNLSEHVVGITYERLCFYAMCDLANNGLKMDEISFLFDIVDYKYMVDVERESRAKNIFSKLRQLVFIFLASIMLIACGGKKKHERYIVNQLPNDVKISGFNEQYDKPYGRYELHFFLKNETGKIIEHPQIDGDLYIGGKLEGTVTGGVAKRLANLDSGVVSFSYIMPKQVPDSIVFKFIK